MLWLLAFWKNSSRNKGSCNKTCQWRIWFKPTLFFHCCGIHDERRNQDKIRYQVLQWELGFLCLTGRSVVNRGTFKWRMCWISTGQAKPEESPNNRVVNPAPYLGDPIIPRRELWSILQCCGSQHKITRGILSKSFYTHRTDDIVWFRKFRKNWVVRLYQPIQPTIPHNHRR